MPSEMLLWVRTPLDNDTFTLINAVNLVSGHRQAWELAGVLHRDVSVGNILIVEDPETGSFTGFIHDFDYSSMTKAPPMKNEESDDHDDALADSEPTEDDQLAAQKERTVSRSP